jgi:protein phosphatase inhibitor 2
VHVDDAGSGHDNDDDELVGLSAEEREKHRRFQAMRKKHYEMKGVAHLLGHPEELDDLVEDGGDDGNETNGSAVPPVPPLPRND